MKQDVLSAIETAFHPQGVEEHLDEKQGRVFGSVKIIGSPTFDALDDIRRQRLFWDQLRLILGPSSTAVGPVVLEPTRRG